MPFKLRDEDIPDDWSCERNVWDREHASCSIPQALTDEEIDEILALQVRPLGAVLHVPQEYVAASSPPSWAPCHDLTSLLILMQDQAVLEAGEMNLADAADLAAFQDAG